MKMVRWLFSANGSSQISVYFKFMLEFSLRDRVLLTSSEYRTRVALLCKTVLTGIFKMKENFSFFARKPNLRQQKSRYILTLQKKEFLFQKVSAESMNEEHDSWPDFQSHDGTRRGWIAEHAKAFHLPCRWLYWVTKAHRSPRELQSHLTFLIWGGIQPELVIIPPVTLLERGLKVLKFVTRPNWKPFLRLNQKYCEASLQVNTLEYLSLKCSIFPLIEKTIR